MTNEAPIFESQIQTGGVFACNSGFVIL